MEKANTTKKRGRPKKVVAPEIVNEQTTVLKMSAEKDKKVTVEEVRQEYVSTYGRILQNSNPHYEQALTTLNSHNPFISNQRIKQISSMALSKSKEVIIEALKAPQMHEQTLREAGWALSATQGIYNNILRNACDIPLFNYYKTPVLLENEKEYSSASFKSEDKFLDSWVEKLDVKNTFKKIALEVKREGKSTYMLRSSFNRKVGAVNYAYLQKMPSDYIKLTGIGDKGYIASFNMMIFLKAGFSLSQYPPFLREVWNDMVGKEVFSLRKSRSKNQPDMLELNLVNAQKYTYNYEGRELKSIIESKDRTYMMWVQLPPEECFTFESDTSHPWVIPDTSNLFLNLQELTDYSVLAGLIASTPLTTILTGEAELISQNNLKAGKDETALSADTILGLQNLFNSMTSTNVEAFFAPLKNLKLQALPNAPNSSGIQSEAVKNFINMAGEGGIIVATDKPSIAQVKGVQQLTASRYDFVTRQFERAVTFIINNLIGCEYQWKFFIWGDIYNREADRKFLKEMVGSGGTFFLPKLLSAEGLSINDAKSINNYFKSQALYDDFSPLIQTKATLQQAEEKKVGRPAKDEDDIDNDSTAQSRGSGGNITEHKTDYSYGMCVLCGEGIESEDEETLICSSCAEECQIERG